MDEDDEVMVVPPLAVWPVRLVITGWVVGVPSAIGFDQAATVDVRMAIDLMVRSSMDDQGVERFIADHDLGSGEYQVYDRETGAIIHAWPDSSPNSQQRVIAICRALNAKWHHKRLSRAQQRAALEDLAPSPRAPDLANQRGQPRSGEVGLFAHEAREVGLDYWEGDIEVSDQHVTEIAKALNLK